MIGLFTAVIRKDQHILSTGMNRTNQDEILDIFQSQDYKSRYTNLACIGDVSILIRTLQLYAETEDIDELREYFINTNPFNYSTRASRGRHFRSIEPLLLNTHNEKHEKLLKHLAQAGLRQECYRHLLYLQVCLNSRLFREITLNVFDKKMKQGALKLTKHSINDYILEHVPPAKEWTETTVERLGTRYLSLMHMFGFIEGEDRDQIAVISPSNQVLVSVVYLDQALRDDPSIQSDEGLYQFLFIRDESRFLDRLKDLALDGYFDLQAAGSDVRISSLLEVEDLVQRLTG
jgi:hypothetical protein